jgi:small subunit ribosomal protein S3
MDLEKRVPFRKVMKQLIGRVERGGALGVKVSVSGRLNGAEIARTEKLVSGKVPLQTLRADIDYARGAAQTTYGTIGIKVWIYKGEVFEKDQDNKGELITA